MRRSRLSYFKVSVTLYESVCVWVRMFVIAWCDCVRACMCLFVYVHLCDWEGGGGGGVDDENDYFVRDALRRRTATDTCVRGHPTTHNCASIAAHRRRIT